MSSVPAGAALARPFVPARDFALSRRFYRTLGFEPLLESDEVAIFGIGGSSFLLQNHYQQDWAANFMMQLMVDDLDAWYAHLLALDLPASFPGTSLKPPQLQPWGLRIAYLVDPSGVLWHVAQRRSGVAHDAGG